MNSIPHSAEKQRELLLELHQLKSIEIFKTLKEVYPDENLFSLSSALLILLIPLVDDVPARQILIKYLAKNLDTGVAIGLLPKQEESSDVTSLPEDVRGVTKISDIPDIQPPHTP